MGCRDRIYGQNFDAVLAVVVIFAGEAILVKFDWKCRKLNNKYTIMTFFEFTFSKNPGTPLFAKKKRLQQAYRPHQAYNI